MVSDRKRSIAGILSFFVVGAGQIYVRRYWAGIWFALFFYGIIAFMKSIWNEMNPGFWVAFGSLVVFWLFNILDALKGPRFEKPPCEKACPAGIAPWVYVNQVGAGAAWRYPFVPFFKTLGLICPAPCECECTRRGIDEPVAIRELKAGVEVVKPAVSPQRRKERIAVIGAGPCGLTAAYYLTLRGYQVIVYEKETKPGGVLSAFIPEFRLPASVVKSEVEELVSSGFEIKYGVTLGKEMSLDAFLERHDYVMLATGAWLPVGMSIPGEDQALGGLDVLARIKKGEKFDLGRVGVIGGGNTAMDVARSLRRMGNEVTVYYRRRVEDMPAEPEHRILADEEGIKIMSFTTPIALGQGKVIMAKTRCAAEGRQAKVEVIAGSQFEAPLDKVVMAIGQKPDTETLRAVVAVDERGQVKVKRGGQTSHPRIFAGGDVVLGAKTLAHAVGQGIECARAIDRRIRRIPNWLARLVEGAGVPDGIKMLNMTNEHRLQVKHRAVAERLTDFNATRLPPTKEALVSEANRCLTCPLRYRP